MTDSVPAPMVQLPAETVEKLREAVADWEASDDNDSYADLTLATAAHRLVDAATPAASVPAADILALADKWERIIKYRDHSGELRALVAAAEQADKGEAADTPRDEYDAHLGTTIAPAAPVGEPPCKCGHGPDDHDSEGICCRVHPDFPLRLIPCVAPVPVNDEAEAAWQAWDSVLDATADLDITEFTKAAFKYAYRQSLLDAADQITVCTCGESTGTNCENCWWAKWLMDRAARGEDV